MLWTCYGISNVLSVGGTFFLSPSVFGLFKRKPHSLHSLLGLCIKFKLDWKMPWFDVCSNFGLTAFGLFLPEYLSFSMSVFLFELFYLLPTHIHFYHLLTRTFFYLLPTRTHFYPLLTHAFLSPSYSHFFIPILLYLLLYLHSFLARTLYFYSLSPCTLYLSSSSSHSTSIFIPFFSLSDMTRVWFELIQNWYVHCTIINRICNELPV